MIEELSPAVRPKTRSRTRVPIVLVALLLATSTMRAWANPFQRPRSGSDGAAQRMPARHPRGGGPQTGTGTSDMVKSIAPPTDHV